MKRQFRYTFDQIDSRAPHSLRVKLLNYLNKGNDPANLPYGLRYFKPEGGFFSYEQHPDFRHKPMLESLWAKKLSWLKEIYGDALFESLEDFKARKEVVALMMRSAGREEAVNPGLREDEIEVALKLFGHYAKKAGRNPFLFTAVHMSGDSSDIYSVRLSYFDKNQTPENQSIIIASIKCREIGLAHTNSGELQVEPFPDVTFTLPLRKLAGNFDDVLAGFEKNIAEFEARIKEK